MASTYAEEQKPRDSKSYEIVKKRNMTWIKKYLKDGRLLDLGGYNGRLTEELSNVLLTDIATSPLLHRVNPSHLPACVDMHFLPFKSASLDGVLLSHSLQHTPEPEVVIDEVFRVLKLSGKIFISVPNAAAFTQRWRLKRNGEVTPSGNRPGEKVMQFHQYTCENLMQFLKKKSFRVEKTYGSLLTFPLMEKLGAYRVATFLADNFYRSADSLFVVAKKI